MAFDRDRHDTSVAASVFTIAFAICAAALLCPPAAPSETVFSAASSNGDLRVSVSIEPFPVTCAHPLVVTLSAVTQPESVVHFGSDPTGEPHLDLHAFTHAGKLSAGGRTVTRSRVMTYLPDLPAETHIAGRTIIVTAPDGRHGSITIPDLPITVAPLIPENVDPDLRDIAPPMPLPGHSRKKVVTVAVCVLVFVGAFLLAGRFLAQRRHGHPAARTTAA